MTKHYEALMRLKEVVSKIDTDDPDFDEIAENETDYKAFLNWALKKYAYYKEMEDANKRLKDLYDERAKSYQKSQEYFKEYMGEVLSTAGKKTFKGEAGSITHRAISQKPMVTDESKIPEEFFKKTIDKTAINNAIKSGQEIDGMVMSNGGESLAIRTK